MKEPADAEYLLWITDRLVIYPITKVKYEDTIKKWGLVKGQKYDLFHRGDQTERLLQKGRELIHTQCSDLDTMLYLQHHPEFIEDYLTVYLLGFALTKEELKMFRKCKDNTFVFRGKHLAPEKIFPIQQIKIELPWLQVPKQIVKKNHW